MNELREAWPLNLTKDGNNLSFIRRNIISSTSINAGNKTVYYSQNKRHILDCYIDFNPDYLICKECLYYEDCSIHYVIINQQVNAVLDV